MWGAVTGVTPIEEVQGTGPESSDLDLYRALAERVERGESYYAATAAEQPARGYPTRPFLTWRLPTATWLIAATGEAGAVALLRLLAVATTLTWWDALRRAGRGSRGALAGAAAIATVGLLGLGSSLAYLHELWAGLLVALSLALWGRWWPVAAMVGLAAVALREQAALYLLVMLIAAAREGRRTEAAAWAGTLGLAALGLTLHASAVASSVPPDGSSSAGWLALGGYPQVLLTGQWNAVVLLLGAWLVLFTVPLALLGAATWTGPLGTRVGLTVCAYTGAFLVAGRPENHYWGLVVAPLAAVALTWAPRAVRGLVEAARPARADPRPPDRAAP